MNNYTSETVAFGEEVRLIIVGVSEVFRHAIVYLLRDTSAFNIAADVSDFQKAQQLLSDGDANVVLLGLSHENDVQFINNVKNINNTIKIVALARDNTEDMFVSAVKAGVDGYILENSRYDRLVEAINNVMIGSVDYDSEMCSPVVHRLICNESEFEKNSSALESELHALSFRERQVVELLSKGLANKEIARELGISLSTTKTHISRIFNRLNIKSRRELLPKIYDIGKILNRQ